jgi:hypothetical protein
MQRLIRIALKANDWIIETQYRQYIICKLRYGTFMCRHAWMKAPFIYVGWMYRLVVYIHRTHYQKYCYRMRSIRSGSL